MVITPHSTRPAVTLRAAIDADVAVAADSSLVQVSELRSEVGLFSDTSQDDLLTEYLLFALEKMEEMVGHAIIKRKTTDKYAMSWYNRYQVSSRGLKAIDQADLGVQVWSDGSLVEVDKTTWYMDPTPSPAHIVFTSTPSTDDRYALPLEISYSVSVGEQSPESIEQLRQCVRYIVGVLYENRGTSALPHNWDRGLTSLLGSKHRMAV